MTTIGDIKGDTRSLDYGPCSIGASPDTTYTILNEDAIVCLQGSYVPSCRVLQ